MIRQAATKYRIDPDLLTALVKTESGNDPNAVSPKGAKGLGQLMDATAAQYGVTNPFDPAQNLAATAQHLSYLLNKYGGNKALVLAAYNAGEGAVDRAQGVPNILETVNYVKRVGAEMTAMNDRAAAASGRPGVGYVGPQKLPGDYIEVDRGGRPPPGIAPTTTGIGNIRNQRDLSWMGAGAPNPPQGPTAFMGAGAPPTPRGPVSQIPITSAVGSLGTPSGIGRLSSQQLQDQMDQLSYQQTGMEPQDSRTKDDLYMSPTSEYPVGAPGPSYSRSMGVPDYGDYSSTQASIAPFYSGGTFPSQEQSSGLGWLSKFFKPVGSDGRWFTDQAQSEGGR
jgi:hypothetical protein